MISEHDRVVLTDDLSDYDLEAGDVGTVVHVYGDRAAFEVEFFTLEGDTVSVATVSPAQVRPVNTTDITHARSAK